MQVRVAACRILPLETYSHFSQTVMAQIADDGAVADAASDAVRKARSKVRSIEQRARAAIAKRGAGEATQFQGRWCIALPKGVANFGWAHLLAHQIVQAIGGPFSVITFSNAAR